MYKVLPGYKKTLICTDEVVAQSAVDQNVDVRHIEAAIQIAEERFISHAICIDFYNDFRTKKNQEVTLVNKAYLEGLVGTALVVGQLVNSIDFISDLYYRDFWFEHLWKWLAEAVVYIASPTNYSRFTSQGEMENNPNNAAFEGRDSASVPLQNMKWKMDKMMQDRIDPLRASAEEYLYENIGQFPLVNCKAWNYTTAIPTGVSVLRKTGWIHGIYDDPKGGRCCPPYSDTVSTR